MIHSLKILNALGGEYKAKPKPLLWTGCFAKLYSGSFWKYKNIQVLMILKVRQ